METGKMETITRINGNGQSYTTGLPLLVIATYINDGALRHIKENTGLDFTKKDFGMLAAQPETSAQIAALLMTYNFKTRYYNNGDCKNTLFLKSDHHIGYDIDSVCVDCLARNHVNANGIEKGDFLSC